MIILIILHPNQWVVIIVITTKIITGHHHLCSNVLCMVDRVSVKSPGGKSRARLTNSLRFCHKCHPILQLSPFSPPPRGAKKNSHKMFHGVLSIFLFLYPQFPMLQEQGSRGDLGKVTVGVFGEEKVPDCSAAWTIPHNDQQRQHQLDQLILIIDQ